MRSCTAVTLLQNCLRQVCGRHRFESIAGHVGHNVKVNLRHRSGCAQIRSHVEWLGDQLTLLHPLKSVFSKVPQHSCKAEGSQPPHIFNAQRAQQAVHCTTGHQAGSQAGRSGGCTQH